jgi:hypothetical protein
MQQTSVVKNVGKFCGFVLLMGLMSGCISGMTGETDSSMPLTGEDLAPVATMVESYGDIELPIEMTLSQDKSMAMRTDSFQGGIHSYSGRVQINSLRDYIIVSMRNNKWKLVGEASYKNVLLAFRKTNKTCMFVLSESLGKTQANLYVTVDVSAENKLNPFGGSVSQ